MIIESNTVPSIPINRYNYRTLKTIFTYFIKEVSLIITLAVLLQIPTAKGQDMYLKTFGNTSSIPIIFLHGGPGYNCSSFEVTTAQKLADEGYYVVVYDRRGEGRSGEIAEYTFEQTHSDLLGIMDSFHLVSANLMGHSFGGMVAITFAEKYKERVQSIVLISAPVSLQQSFKTIIHSCENIYTESNNSTNLSYIKMLKEMDPTSIQYSSYCFLHAMQNGFYSPANPSPEALEIYSLFRTDSTLLRYASKMGYTQPQGFWKNERYTSLDLIININSLKENGTPIYGIYGQEDGLYSVDQINQLTTMIGTEHILYLDNCSHSVFIDQQDVFIQGLNNWLR